MVKRWNCIENMGGCLNGIDDVDDGVGVMAFVVGNICFSITRWVLNCYSIHVICVQFSTKFVLTVFILLQIAFGSLALMLFCFCLLFIVDFHNFKINRNLYVYLSKIQIQSYSLADTDTVIHWNISMNGCMLFARIT